MNGRKLVVTSVIVPEAVIRDGVRRQVEVIRRFAETAGRRQRFRL
jgi:hypothetical protein